MDKRSFDLDVNLLEQLPPWYRKVLDYQEICQTEQAAFDALALEIVCVADNFFLQTMDSATVSGWESILHITPDPTMEDLAFRRFRILNRISSRPPFTMAFLAKKLDEIIGAGNWTVHMDYPHYTLYVESSAEDQLYAGELAVTIGAIKPAHIVYINTPLIDAAINLSEEIAGVETRWNYRLGSWALSSAPFRFKLNEEVVKMPQTPSIQSELLSGVAVFTSDDVASARINGSIIVSNMKKSVTENLLTITYDVLAFQTTEVTSVELLNAEGVPLTASAVYVPVGNDGILMKHTITVKEGN